MSDLAANEATGQLTRRIPRPTGAHNGAGGVPAVENAPETRAGAFSRSLDMRASQPDGRP